MPDLYLAKVAYLEKKTGAGSIRGGVVFLPPPINVLERSAPLFQLILVVSPRINFHHRLVDGWKLYIYILASNLN